MKKIYFYFDESGNLGKDNRYFVISCIITKKPKPLENKMKKVLLHIKKTYKNIKWNRYELKANSCKPNIKEIIYKSVLDKDFQIAYIAADKYWINENLFENKNRLYNYLLKLLLDNYKNFFENNSIKLVLDNKTIKVESLNSFEDYINIHINYELNLNSIIKVEYRDSASKNSELIQLADFIANAIFAKYEYGYNRYFDIFKDKINKKELFPTWKFGTDKKELEDLALEKDA
ncbi:DUF3800 domain-containing protein [uncultured Clostridium sp.]|jgi:hypothetical protein|uniref:DUF3800 domain-containing protein n=1 Tax=uncultured Clostridium sp. TaxID=59620 RepID=UPI00280B265A|nr:DUF3800 domain-containing protein [uncultured Clostridium sp.]